MIALSITNNIQQDIRLSTQPKNHLVHHQCTSIMFFDYIVKETAALNSEDKIKTIEEALKTRAKDEMLWRDEFIDRLAPIRSITHENAIGVAHSFYSTCWLEPVKIRVELILHCVGNLPDVFRGVANYSSNLFETPASWKGQEITRLPVTEPYTYNPARGQVLRFCEDPYNPLNSRDLIIDEEVYFKWLEADDLRIRSTLGIISLALLGLYTRSVAQVKKIVNGYLYVRWAHLFAVQAPPAISLFSDSRLADIKEGLRNSQLSARILAMCERKADEDGKFKKAFEFLVVPISSAYKFHLEGMFDTVEEKTGIPEPTIRVLLECMSKTLSQSDALRRVKIQYEKFLKTMRYIAVGYHSEVLLEDGSKFRTKYFRCARLIDPKFFQSIVGNESLRSFFAGFIDDSEKKCSFTPQDLCEECYAAGKEFRDKLNNGAVVNSVDGDRAIEGPNKIYSLTN